MIVSPMRVWWLTWATLRPARRRAFARTSPMLTPRLPLQNRAARRPARSAGGHGASATICPTRNRYPKVRQIPPAGLPPTGTPRRPAPRQATTLCDAPSAYLKRAIRRSGAKPPLGARDRGRPERGCSAPLSRGYDSSDFSDETCLSQAYDQDPGPRSADDVGSFLVLAVRAIGWAG